MLLLLLLVALIWLFPLVFATDDSIVLLRIVGVVGLDDDDDDDVSVVVDGCFGLDLLVGVVGRDGSIPAFGFLFVGVDDRDNGLDPGIDAAEAAEADDESFLLLIVENIGPLLVVDLAAVFHPLLFLCENKEESLTLVVMRSGFELAACVCQEKIACF